MKTRSEDCRNCHKGNCCAKGIEHSSPAGVTIQKKSLRVGLAGNPNSGKTTLFNSITGARQKVGNYAGVTVEKKVGYATYMGVELVIYDLPGIYSMTAYSLDEIITRNFIINEKPDIVVDVIDSLNIERNLMLYLQFQELGIPVIGALNMTDEAKSRGVNINEEELSRILGLPMIKISAKRGTGLEALLQSIINLAASSLQHTRNISYGVEVEREINSLLVDLATDQSFALNYSLRWTAIKLLEKDVEMMNKIKTHRFTDKISKAVSVSIQNLERHFGKDSEIIMSEQRYAYVHGAVSETVTRTGDNSYLSTEMVDSLLLNRVVGLPLFFLAIWLIFQTTFTLGKYPVLWLEFLFSWMSETTTTLISNPTIRSLLVDGIIGGVGGVLSFVPLVIILFTCISFLEETGYMARATFLMDKFLHLFGLHGQSFVPMIIGFGCSVPAIMAARTLKNERDRIITVLVTPFMSCGAKLPVYILLAGAFFPDNTGNAVMAIYLCGVIFALFSALIFSKTILAGNETPFVMELPPYRMPTIRGIVWHVWDKTAGYIKKAGTVLLAASILIWIAISFPKPPDQEARYQALALDYKNAHPTLPSEKLSAYIRTVKLNDALVYSTAGRIGKFIEPFLRPIGLDWKMGISIITGMAAKEAVVSTLGVLYNEYNPEDGKSFSLRSAIRSDPAMNKLVAFILMIVTLIAPPCIAALSVIASEIGWKWLGFSIIYKLSVAWLISFGIYQIGVRLF